LIRPSVPISELGGSVPQRRLRSADFLSRKNTNKAHSSLSY